MYRKMCHLCNPLAHLLEAFWPLFDPPQDDESLNFELMTQNKLGHIVT